MQMEEDLSRYFIGVKFDGAGKSYYFSTDMDDLKVGEQVVVETVSGLELGTTSTSLMPSAAYSFELGSQADSSPRQRRRHRRLQYGHQRSGRSHGCDPQKVAELGLPMNLIAASYTLDGEAGDDHLYLGEPG
jgi:cell fate regulator YaaT (PSP1 superfamily)